MKEITSLKIPKEINVELMIISRLLNKTKEQLTAEILSEGLKPYANSIIRQRFK